MMMHDELNQKHDYFVHSTATGLQVNIKRKFRRERCFDLDYE